MRLGMMIGAAGAPWDVFGQVDQVVLAEKDGFESFWFAQIGGLDALTVIAMAGPRTSRIEIGTAVVPTYTRHPNVMAQQALTANAATGGRLTLGIGPSHRPGIERLGLSYDHAARHVREYLSALRPLVHEGRVSFQGKVFKITAALQVPGARPFPILISALAPLMLQIAGELADGTVTWMVGRRTLETHIVPRITDAATRAGRGAPRVCVAVPVAVCDDAGAGKERAARNFQGYGQLTNYRRMLDIEGGGPESVAVCGPEDAVERELRAFAAAGATDLLASIYPVGEDTDASVSRTRAFLKTLIGKL